MARINRLQYLRHVRQHRRQIFMIFMLWQLQNVTREIWVHPLNIEREEKGEFYVLYPDLWHYHKRFFKTYRMSVERFDTLLELVGPRIAKKYTNFWCPISAEQLLVTLRYMLIP